MTKEIFGVANPPLGKKYDFKYAYPIYSNKGFAIRWGAAGMGFGGVYFHVDKEGKTTVDTECMSKEFVKELLEYFVDNLEEI